MRIVLISALTFLLTTLLNAQEKIDAKKMVGFACYYGGQPTEPVMKVTELLEKKHYKDVASFLNSGNPAKVYLAVISIEKLVELGEYQLSVEEKILISRAKNSGKRVFVCGGCTYFDKITLKQMLSEDNFIGSDYWLEDILLKE
jgi:hypothetical protein